jgi:hypothetical protein
MINSIKYLVRIFTNTVPSVIIKTYVMAERENQKPLKKMKSGQEKYKFELLDFCPSINTELMINSIKYLVRIFTNSVPSVITKTYVMAERENQRLLKKMKSGQDERSI